MQPETIRILLVEDERLLRETLAALLQMEPDLLLVGAVVNGEQAVAEAMVHRPQVVLADIKMPRLSGIEAARRIKAALPDTEIVILTQFDDDASVFAALKAGAIGYLLKDAGLEEIVDALRAAARKEGRLSPPLVARVVAEFARLSQAIETNRALFAALSHRELEVLELLGQGLRNSVIAETLFISEKTVKNHITHILHKLQVNDRVEAALLAQKHGLADRK